MGTVHGCEPHIHSNFYTLDLDVISFRILSSNVTAHESASVLQLEQDVIDHLAFLGCNTAASEIQAPTQQTDLPRTNALHGLCRLQNEPKYNIV